MKGDIFTYMQRTGKILGTYLDDGNGDQVKLFKTNTRGNKGFKPRLYLGDAPADAPKPWVFTELPAEYTLARRLGYKYYAPDRIFIPLDTMPTREWAELNMNRQLTTYLHATDEPALTGLKGPGLAARVAELTRIHCAAAQGDVYLPVVEKKWSYYIHELMSKARAPLGYDVNSTQTYMIELLCMRAIKLMDTVNGIEAMDIAKTIVAAELAPIAAKREKRISDFKAQAKADMIARGLLRVVDTDPDNGVTP